MSDYYKTSQSFWTSRRAYPSYPSLLKRRFLDLAFVLNHVSDTKSVLDLGCGDGYLMLLLRELTQIEEFYAYDISIQLLEVLEKKWLHENDRYLYTKITNFIKEESFPKTDITVCFGSFPYVFDIEDLNSVLEKIDSSKILIRNPCSIDGSAVSINKFSEELGAEYSAIYRTPDEYFSILSKHFKVTEMFRAYPNDIESKYGTKHFFFTCERR
jgi:SAM-dependent methyltransferase